MIYGFRAYEIKYEFQKTLKEVPDLKVEKFVDWLMDECEYFSDDEALSFLTSEADEGMRLYLGAREVRERFEKDDDSDFDEVAKELETKYGALFKEYSVLDFIEYMY